MKLSWRDLKCAVNEQKDTNIPELKLFWTEKVAKFPLSWCEGMKKKLLLQLLLQMKVTLKAESNGSFSSVLSNLFDTRFCLQSFYNINCEVDLKGPAESALKLILQQHFYNKSMTRFYVKPLVKRFPFPVIPP